MRTRTTVVGLPLCRDIRAAIRESTLACTDMWVCAIAWADMDAHAGVAMSGSRLLSYLPLGSFLSCQSSDSKSPPDSRDELHHVTASCTCFKHGSGARRRSTWTWDHWHSQQLSQAQCGRFRFKVPSVSAVLVSFCMHVLAWQNMEFLYGVNC